MKWETKILNIDSRHFQKAKNIIQEYLKGGKQVDIAKKYTLSKQRVSQIIIAYKNKELDFLFLSKKRILKEFFQKGLPLNFLKTYSKRQNEFVKYCKEKKYTILRNGFPDYLIRKDDRWIAVEVKDSAMEELTLAQELMKMFFESLGIEFKIYNNRRQRKNFLI